MPESSTLLFLSIGLAAGILSGIFGIGGGVVIVPALIYLGGFTQHRATGTSLAVLLPPIGIGAMWILSTRQREYAGGNNHRRSRICWWLARRCPRQRVSGPYLRLAFGVFVVSLGIYLLFGAFRRLNWI